MGILLAGLCACANVAEPVLMYVGEKRPDAEIVRIQLPSALEVLNIDGKELEKNYVGDGFYLIEVLPGRHNIQVAYVELWGDPTSSFPATSNIFQFNILAAAGRYYEFKHNGPYDLIAAESALVSELDIWLVQVDTGQTIYADNIKVYGSIVNRVLGTAGSLTKQENQIPTSAEVIVSQNGSAQSALAAEQIIIEQDAFKMLQFWWQQADVKQRNAFVHRITYGTDEQLEPVVQANSHQNYLGHLNFWWKVASEKQHHDFKAWIKVQP